MYSCFPAIFFSFTLFSYTFLCPEGTQQQPLAARAQNRLRIASVPLLYTKNKTVIFILKKGRKNAHKNAESRSERNTEQQSKLSPWSSHRLRHVQLGCQPHTITSDRFPVCDFLWIIKHRSYND